MQLFVTYNQNSKYLVKSFETEIKLVYGFALTAKSSSIKEQVYRKRGKEEQRKKTKYKLLKCIKAKRKAIRIALDQ